MANTQSLPADHIPFNGPPELQDQWQAFCADYMENAISLDKQNHLRLLNALVFQHDNMAGFMQQMTAGGIEPLSYNAAIQYTTEHLANLSEDKDFRPLHVEIEKQLMEKWVAIREEAGINPDGLKSTTRENRRIETAKRQEFAHQADAVLLSNAIFHLMPVMPICYDILGKSAGRFSKDQIAAEASALYPNALFAYKTDKGAKFMTYYRNAWLEKQLWRRLAEQLPDVKRDGISLDKTIGTSDDGSQFGNLIADTKASNPHEIALADDLWEQVSGIMSDVLDEREVAILRMRYGLEEDLKPHRGEDNVAQPMTLDEVGNVLGISSERIRQIESRAIRKLQNAKLSNVESAPEVEEPVTAPPVPYVTPEMPASLHHSQTTIEIPALDASQSKIADRNNDYYEVKNIITRMYHDEHFLKQELLQQPSSSLAYKAAYVLNQLGTTTENSSITSDLEPEMEAIYLAGMLTSPERMIPHTRMNAYPGTRLEQLVHIVESMDAETDINKPSETVDHKTADNKPTSDQQDVIDDPQNDVYQQQSNAIAEARKAYEDMGEYSWEKARLIAANLFIALAKPVANTNLPQALQDLAEGKVGRTTFSRWIKDTNTYNVDTFVNGNGIDTFVTNVVSDSLQDEAKCYLLGMPWRNPSISMHDQATYAQDHNMNASDFFRLARYQQRMNTRDYAKHLDVNATVLSRVSFMPTDEQPTNVIRPVRAVLDGLMDHMELAFKDSDDKAQKAETARSRAIIRKMTLGISHDVTQQTLNQCFSADSSDKIHFVDRNATGDMRAQAMALFFKTLREVHGLRDRNELAHEIANHEGLGEHAAKRMHSIIHSVSVPESQIECNPDEMEHSHRIQKTIAAENIRDAIAQFAFPDDPALQETCKQFLGHENYQAESSHQDVIRRAGGDHQL